MNVYANYIRTIPLGLDLAALTNTCTVVNLLVNQKFSGNTHAYSNDDKAPLSTSVFNEYNFLLLPLPGVHELYEAIRSNFRHVSGKTNPHFIGCWLNYYKENDYLGWHKHWKAEADSWHGYYCVNAEPSITSYKLDNVPEEIHIENKNNTLVISQSGLDEHRTYPWKNIDIPRITIAFDIVPQEHIGLSLFNHWMPI